ncbi:MAG: Ig-like domain-containing protein [PVC group bacterium]|nr:Ig-like domain-containing protein [PVC group bacterium]
MNKKLILLIVCFIVTFSFNALAQNTSSPRVVKTSPDTGDMAVDPSIKEITVTFSEDMITDNMWSWVMASKETFPQINGQVHYLDDKRTCVAPVKLESGKTYVIWFNSQQYNAFRDVDNNPAIPYLLEFKTK